MNMTGNGTSDCTGELLYPSTILLAILYSISGVMSLGGNGVVLWAIYKTPSLHTYSNYYIASLALADFVVGLIVNPLWAAKSALNIWENQHPLTIATEFMSVQTVLTTTWNLAIISIDRYFAVTSVYRYLRVMTTWKCLAAILFVWCFSILLASVRLLITDIFDLPKLWISVAILGVTVPLSVITYCYYYIFKVATRQVKQIAVETSLPSDNSKLVEVKKNKKAAWTIGIVIGIFLVLYLPSMTISGIQLITTDDCLKIKIIRAWFWGGFFAYSSSCCNPWVYAARSREFRPAFRHISSRVKCIRSTNSEPKENDSDLSVIKVNNNRIVENTTSFDGHPHQLRMPRVL